MVNFLTKLFRKKGNANKDERKLKKSRKVSNRTKAAAPDKVKLSSPLQPRDEDLANRTPTATTASDRGSNASRPQKVLSPHSPKQHAQAKRRGAAPVDLDDTEESDENRNRPDPGISFQQLQQFNRQQQQPPNAPSPKARQLYVQSPTSNNGDAMERGSDCSSSDFNLSTDAEDTEYNNLRRGVGGQYLNSSNLDTSGMSAMSSPTNYTTDDDNAIFPALQTDDDATTTTKKDPAAHPDDEVKEQAQQLPNIKIVPMAHETEDDIRAWTLSPSSQPSTAKASDTNPTTSPKYASTKINPTDVFGNFANFDDFLMMERAKPKPTSSRSAPGRKFLVDGPDKLPDNRPARRKPSSTASLAQPETSLSDLLAQAKQKNSRKKGSSSVNSAPVITLQYLREHHKLGRLSNVDSLSADKTTSVTDIIQSLEATNASRLKTSRGSSSRSHRSRDFDAHSHTSNGGTSTRSAKERLREKRRQERNHAVGSDESENEETESWLFDEVTGALGPRGVAADMESLGGKSNLSKNSAGNKSHRSHRSHKSHRSHRSSHRRKKSSNESVDSRNSRNSRYSHRSTRSYLSQMSEQSRSVANDLLRLEMQLAMVGSQEVSGDDAINTSKAGGNGSVTGSTGGASRASRTSRTSHRSSTTRNRSSVTKRSKMTVVAPPGKLGIILANKADSKGTIVSGVRTSSVLAEKISPGDRIIAIDDEDVSLMTVSEITTIMARKSDFERQLTVMTTPKHLGLSSRGDFGETTTSESYYRR